jgi:capsular exopolysaccharide synthesis family protein
MMELSRQISDTKGALNAEIMNVVRGIQDNYVAAQAKEQALQAEAQKQQQAALNLKQLGVEYAVLQEEVNVNRGLYDSVLKRLSETNVSNDLAVSNMRITQRAETPLFPSYPDISFNLLVVSALGLFLGVGLAFFLEYMDSTVCTPEDVWRAASLNTLGVVPHLSSLKNPASGYRRLGKGFLLTRPLHRKRKTDHSRSRELILSQHPLSIVSESYRIIRTALLLSQAEKPPRVVLISSPCSQEGKTVTTLNLAIALAQDGHSVLVIDADLRKGCCHDRLGLKNHKGLTDVLTGRLRLEEVVEKTSISGLSFLSRGLRPPDPSRLLGSHKMKEVLKLLRESYNFILVDSPPVIAVSDAAVLSALADGVLLVVNGKMTPAASAREAVERLEAVCASIIGVVLNGVDFRDPAYAYYRNYYYAPDYVSAEGQMNGGDEQQVAEHPLQSAVAVDTSAATEVSPGVMSGEFF